LGTFYGITTLLVATSWWVQALPELIFPLLAGAGVIYCAFVLYHAMGEKRITSQALDIWFVFSGITGLLILASIQTFSFLGIAPVSFAFIPLVFLALGVVMNEEDKEEPVITRGELIKWILAAFILLPISYDIVVLVLNLGSINLGMYLSDLLSFGLAKIISITICVSLALFLFTRKTDQTNKTLLAMNCMLMAILNLRDVVIALLPETNTLQIFLLHDIFIAASIGSYVHLVYRIARQPRSLAIPLGYGISGILISLLIFKAGLTGMAGIQGGGIMHAPLVWVLLAIFCYCSVVLFKASRKETDPQRKEGLRIFFIGFGLAILIQAFNFLSGLGIDPVQVDTLLVIPLALIVYGLTYKDLLNMSMSSKRQMLTIGLKAVLAIAYIAISPVFFWMLHEYGALYVINRIVPYGIPPLLSFLCAAFLSLFVLGLEQNRLEAMLFSLISFCYALLNLDITLVAIVPDINLALKISRLDHFFLCLIMFGVNLHLAYLVIGKKTKWWVVYAAYSIGIIMAPLSQTRYYFQGMYTYYWGYFAHKAILFDVMSGLWLAGLIYGIYLLNKERKKTKALQKTKVSRVLRAFQILAALSMSNIPAINGVEFYPLGTFAFIGLTYLAYGLFVFNLRHALQQVRTAVFWIGIVILLGVIGLFPGKILHIENHTTLMLVSVLGVVILFRPARKGWNAVVNLFIMNERDELNDEYARFTENLSHIHHLKDIHQALNEWSFRVFSTTFCALLVRREDNESLKGWNTWNTNLSSGLFSKDDDIPCGEHLLDIEPDHAISRIVGMSNGIASGDMLAKMLSELPSKTKHDSELFEYAEILLPVSLGDHSLAVLLLGRKNNGSGYRASEIDLIQSMVLVMGPYIENALLLESLEGQVDKRTSDLNKALIEAMLKEKEIVSRNEVIERQNQIMAVLLETSTRIHHIEGLDDLFSFTLNQLKILFPDLCGGIILEGAKRNIFEASAFVGLSDAEQKVILEHRLRITEPRIDTILRAEMEKEEIVENSPDTPRWKVFPLQGRSEKAVGYMILKGKDLDGPTGETVILFIAQISAVVQNRLLLTHLERMASTDSLTGVYNRSFLDRELVKAVKHAKRFKHMWFSIMIIDVNGLKQINDTYGHGVGDEAIIKVAGMLKSACRDTDIVSRIGGDEFAVLMPSTNLPQAEILHTRIRDGETGLRVLLTPSEGKHINIPIRISIGLASSDESDPDNVMKMADDRMYLDKQHYYAMRAKESGFAWK
jgi:diguanylate cyclase (GGDEF)-like protein